MKTRIKMQISSNSCPPAATKVPQKINKRRARNFILNVQKLYFQELNPSTPQLQLRPDTRPDKPNKFFKINYRVEQTNLHTQAGGTVRRGDGEMGSRQKGFFSAVGSLFFTPQSKSSKIWEAPPAPFRFSLVSIGKWVIAHVLDWEEKVLVVLGQSEKSLENFRLKVATLLIISRRRQRPQ